MKKLILLMLTSIYLTGFAQVDTISTNIYQQWGNLGVGTNSPASPLEVIGNGFHTDVISTKNNNYSRYAAYSFSDIWHEIPCFVGFRARGSIYEPQNIGDNDRITGLYGSMYIDGDYHTSSAVEIYAGENISSTSAPSYLIFGTTPSGSIERVERMRISPDGKVGIGTNSPEHKFEVSDNNSHFFIKEGYSPTWQNYSAAMGIGYLGGGHATLLIDGADGDFTGMDYGALTQFNDLTLELSNRSNSRINFGVGGDYFSPEHIKMSILHTGDVGIGIADPQYKLDVMGDINFTGNLYKNGILFSGGGSEGWVINGNDMYSAVSGNVGIGTNSMEYKFEVFDDNSHLQFKQAFSPTGQSNFASLGIGYLGNGHAGLFLDGVDGDFLGLDYAALVQLQDHSLVLSNMSESKINFSIGGAFYSPEHTKMSILNTGNVGIGTQEPAAKLQIADGDIYISDINQGIIMKSPDGQCWRGTLDNFGSLNFVAVTCPELTVGQNEMDKPQESFIVFPNPASNFITLNTTNSTAWNMTYSIYSSMGKLLDSGKIKSNMQEIDITGYASGTYVVSIYDKTGNTLFSEQLIRK